MTTKQMFNHLKQSGCVFTQSGHGFDRLYTCLFEDIEIACHNQLGQLVWIVASELGEE